MYIADMAHYLTEIDSIIQSEVQRQTADLQRLLDFANEEAAEATRMKDESWREAHVQQRIADYRTRWQDAQEKLNDIIDAVSHEGDACWMIIEEVREILGVEK